MKICIIGAGAIGGFLAAHMAQEPSNEVSVVVRGRNLEHISAHGIRIQRPTGNLDAKVRATDDPAVLGPQDVVFLTVKEHQLDVAVEMLPPLIGAETLVVPPTTGIPHWYFCDRSTKDGGYRLPTIDPTGRRWTLM